MLLPCLAISTRRAEKSAASSGLNSSISSTSSPFKRPTIKHHECNTTQTDIDSFQRFILFSIQAFREQWKEEEKSQSQSTRLWWSEEELPALSLPSPFRTMQMKDYFEIPWATLRSRVEPSFAAKSLLSHSEYLTKGDIIISTAANVTETEVFTTDGHEVPYSYLVIATGHARINPRVRRDRIEKFQEDNIKIKNSKSILIIGGGPTGVELAAEIAVDYLDKKVTLVHNGPRLLEFIGPKAGNKALAWLKSKKVEVLLDQSIDLESISEADRTYTTSAGEIVAADSFFVCLDRPVATLWLRESVLKERINHNGRLMVDENLRVVGQKNIFAIGDITDIPELKQGVLAQKHAMVVAKNLKILMKGSGDSKLVKYKPSKAMAMVSLGRKNAVAQLPYLTLTGALPGMIRSKNLFVNKTRKQMGLASCTKACGTKQ